MLRSAWFCAGLLLLLGRPAWSWAELGHELVGTLAQAQLVPEADRAVSELLQGEPDPTLGGVAYWADALRASDPERFRATSRWHYLGSTSATCGYDATRDCADGACIVEAIKAQRRILADRSQPREARRDALKFLVHLVGDAHQPLHASNLPDKGGNAFQVSLTTTIAPEAYARDQFHDGVMGTNLHAVWDYYVLAGAGLDLAAYTRHLQSSKPEGSDTPLRDPEQWVVESCTLIEARDLYPETHKMDHAYLDAMQPLAEARVIEAGRRLAQLLNELFGADSGARPAD